VTSMTLQECELYACSDQDCDAEVVAMKDANLAGIGIKPPRCACGESMHPVGDTAGRWLAKSCPRCAGDMSLVQDVDDDIYFSCLQCGHILYQPSVTSGTVVTWPISQVSASGQRRPLQPAGRSAAHR